MRVKLTGFDEDIQEGQVDLDNDDDYTDPYDVICWHPLPEPPKGEE